jgi:hypothetical protein
MIQREIGNKKTGEKIIIFEETDFEHVNPIKHYGDSFIVKQMVLRGVPDSELNGTNRISDKSLSIYKAATANWSEMLAGFRKVNVPEKMIALLTSKRKNEQERLLKGAVLTPDILMAFLIKAHEEFGYTLSSYSSEHAAKGVYSSKMPLAYEVKEDGKVQVYGNTELSEGQLRQAIEQRRVKVGKFIDNCDHWHCFFTTYRSLRGEETWLGEKQPHYHYISNYFGIERTKVIEEIKSERYSLGNLPHLKLEEYGNQPK